LVDHQPSCARFKSLKTWAHTFKIHSVVDVLLTNTQNPREMKMIFHWFLVRSRV
jgi:hypothetical protein